MSASARLASRRVFVDTSAYFALVDDTEADHAEAVALLGRLADARYRQYTTNVVLIECHALMLARLGRARASQFLRSIATSRTTIVRARAQDEERAREILFRYDDKDFSFADAISFVVMQRLGITRAFTLDDHFAQFGFTILTPRTVL
jgi:predicted nucleic acid-binding protein